MSKSTPQDLQKVLKETDINDIFTYFEDKFSFIARISR
jgi:hypothetical protein